MNKIEKLLAELCPDGVEFREVNKVCQISRGRVMSKDYLSANAGKYPVYSSQTFNQGVFGRINTYDYDGEYVTWTTDGANAGSIFHRNGKFSITNVCGLLKPKKDDLNTKYLSSILGIFAKSYVNAGMGNPKIMSNVMAKIPIPIPPLIIQEEIVKILDTFTELQAELQAELEAELQARKKQYEYYRDELLTFGDEVEFKALGEVCLSINAGGDLPENYQKALKVATKEFPYPIYSNGSNEKALYGYTDNYKVANEAVTISARGTIGYHTVRSAKFTPIIRLITLIPNKEIITTRFLNYILDITPIIGTKGAIPQLIVPNVKKILIPIPPLSEQQRIVAILDQFDALVNDISKGLPAEIKARKKQYEYYRNQLLSFKPLQDGPCL